MKTTEENRIETLFF